MIPPWSPLIKGGNGEAEGGSRGGGEDGAGGTGSGIGDVGWGRHPSNLDRSTMGSHLKSDVTISSHVTSSRR